MKALPVFILFAVVSGALITAATLHYSVEPRTNIEFLQMDVYFRNENATADIEYEVGFFSQLFIFFFGSRHLDPYLSELLSDFDEYRVVSVHGTVATVELINASRAAGEYYLHDKHFLGYEVNQLILYYPDNKMLTFYNATETPNTFY